MGWVRNNTGIDLTGKGTLLGGAIDAVTNVVEKVGKVVTSVVEDPKKLAMAALTVAYPGAALNIGSALGLQGAAATAVGNALISTAINGGDISQGVKTAAALYMGGQAAQEIGDLAKASQMDATIANAVSKAGGQAITATALGQDPSLALIAGGANAASGLIAQQIPDFNTWDPTAQRAVQAAISAELQGKDVTAVTANALVNGAINAGQNAYKSWEAESEINKVLDAQTLPEGFKIVPDLSIPSRPQYNLVTPEGTTFARGSDWETLVGMANEQSAARAALQPTPPAPSQTEGPVAPSFVPDETAPSDDFYRSIGIEPESMTDTAPMAQEEIDALLADALATTPAATAPSTAPSTPTTGSLVVNAPGAASTAAPQETVATAETAQKPQLSPDAVLALMQALYPEQAPTEEAPATADIQPGGAGRAADYLGALGEAPDYLGEDILSPEERAMLEAIGLGPEEIDNILAAAGAKGSGAIKPGMGVPSGTFQPAGQRTYDVYRALDKDPAMAAKIRQLPLAGVSDEYVKNFIASAEQGMNPAWATYRPGVEIAKSFQPPLSQGDARTAAYVPKYDVSSYTGFNPEKYGATSASTPEFVGLVTSNPAYLNDPTAAANMLSHELTHVKQVDPGALMSQAGGNLQDRQAFASDLASALPYLKEKYGYSGGYDTQAKAPMAERFADLMGWQFQNNIDFSTDPKFQQMVLNTPERMATWNASTVPRTTRLDPRDLPPGQIVESDFGLPGAAPKSWLLQQLIKNMFGK